MVEARSFGNVKYADITLLCDGKRWRAHRMIICPQSIWLDEKTSSAKLMEDDEIMVDVCDTVTLNRVLQYYYEQNYDDEADDSSDCAALLPPPPLLRPLSPNARSARNTVVKTTPAPEISLLGVDIREIERQFDSVNTVCTSFEQLTLTTHVVVPSSFRNAWCHIKVLSASILLDSEALASVAQTRLISDIKNGLSKAGLGDLAIITLDMTARQRLVPQCLTIVTQFCCSHILFLMQKQDFIDSLERKPGLALIILKELIKNAMAAADPQNSVRTNQSSSPSNTNETSVDSSSLKLDTSARSFDPSDKSLSPGPPGPGSSPALTFRWSGLPDMPDPNDHEAELRKLKAIHEQQKIVSSASINSLRKELDETKRKLQIAESQEQPEQCKNDCKRLNAVVKTKNARIEALEAETVSQNHTISLKQHEIDSQRAELAKRHSNSPNPTIVPNITRAETEAKRLQAQLDDRTAHLARVQASCVSLNRNIKKYKDEAAESKLICQRSSAREKTLKTVNANLIRDKENANVLIENLKKGNNSTNSIKPTSNNENVTRPLIEQDGKKFTDLILEARKLVAQELEAQNETMVPGKDEAGEVVKANPDKDNTAKGLSPRSNAQNALMVEAQALMLKDLMSQLTNAKKSIDDLFQKNSRLLEEKKRLTSGPPDSRNPEYWIKKANEKELELSKLREMVKAKNVSEVAKENVSAAASREGSTTQAQPCNFWEKIVQAKKVQSMPKSSPASPSVPASTTTKPASINTEAIKTAPVMSITSNAKPASPVDASKALKGCERTTQVASASIALAQKTSQEAAASQVAIAEHERLVRRCRLLEANNSQLFHERRVLNDKLADMHKALARNKPGSPGLTLSRFSSAPIAPENSGAGAGKIRRAYDEALRIAGQDFKACNECYVPFHAQFRGAPEDPKSNVLILKCTKCDAECCRWRV